MQSGFSVDHREPTEGYQRLTVKTSLQDLSCQKGSFKSIPYRVYSLQDPVIVRLGAR